MIAETAMLVAMALLGAALAGLYFGGLWLTLRGLPGRRHPMLWLLASAIVRLALLLVALSLVVAGGLGPLLACVAGFLVARTWFLRRARGSGGAPRPSGARASP